MTEWKPIETAPDNTDPVELQLETGRIVLGWRYKDTLMFEIGGGAYVMDGSRYHGDTAVKAVSWRSLPTLSKDKIDG